MKKAKSTFPARNAHTSRLWRIADAICPSPALQLMPVCAILALNKSVIRWISVDRHLQAFAGGVASRGHTGNGTMASIFNVHDAAGYEQLMGRWSQKLAPKFIDFAGLGEGEKILDVGCGTGSLTFALAKSKDLSEIAAIDFSPVFVAEATRRNTDQRINIQQADACALPFEDASFDRALALLVLHFVPETGKAVAEMRRVVRPGGVVAAVVWDHLGGMPGMRMMVDTVAALSEGGRQLRSRYCYQPMMQPGEMKRTFLEQGLAKVEESELMIRMDYQNFDDYWAPIAAGEGPLGKYIATLNAAERESTDKAVRDAYEAGRPDGPRSFANVAWAVRSIVP